LTKKVKSRAKASRARYSRTMTGATISITDGTDSLLGNSPRTPWQQQPGRAAARRAKTTDQ